MIRQGVLVFDDANLDIEELAELKVAGRTVIDRGIRTLARAGIERLLVVLPRGQKIDIEAYKRDLDIYVETASWGVDFSLFSTLDKQFALVMGEYIHHHSSLRTLFARGSLQADLVSQVSNSDEPTTENKSTSRYVRVADEMLTFKRRPAQGPLVSSGAFVCSANTFSMSELLGKSCDIWTFLSRKLQQRTTSTEHTPADLWQQVNGRASARYAKDMLFEQVNKSTSGIIARFLNVRISLPVSKLLVDTGISPNLVTFFFVLLPGLLSAYLVMQPDNYIRLACAGLLWQLASILDGCDGEIARVKLAETQFGAWLDTLTDNLAYLCAYAGMLIGMYHLSPQTLLPIYAGISAIVALLLTLGFLYYYALKTGTGSLQYYLADLSRKIPEDEMDWSLKLIERFGFVTKRDFLSLVIALGVVANQFDLIYWFLVALLHSAALGVLTTTYKMQSRSTRGSVALAHQTYIAASRLPVAQARKEVL